MSARMTMRCTYIYADKARCMRDATHRLLDIEGWRWPGGIYCEIHAREVVDGRRENMIRALSMEPLEPLDPQAARIAALEAALCAFAPNNIKPGHWARPIQLLWDEGYPTWKCRHCDVQADEWRRIEHSSDCPIVLAVSLLPKEATDATTT